MGMRNAIAGWSLLIATVLLCGCATEHPAYTADGRMGHTISCPGTANSWGACYDKAGEFCGAKGYDVMNQNGEHGLVAIAHPSGGFLGSTASREMQIVCKP